MMDGMDEIVQFLRDRYDEDERIARVASGSTAVGEPGAWQQYRFGDEWEASRSEYDDKELLVALRPNLPRPPDVMSGYWGAVFSHRPDDADPDADSPMPSFEHAARHDPARVLREIEAKRRIVELCAPPLVDVTGLGDTERQFVPGEGAAWGEPVLRLLALPYADHSDYRDEWRP